MNPDDEVYVALGRLTHAYSRLESYVDLLLAAAISGDPRVGARVCATRMTFPAKLGLLLDLLRVHLDAELTGTLEACIKKVATAEEERNTLVHSSWDISGGKAWRGKASMTRKQGYRENEEVLSPSDIEAVVRQIGIATEEFSRCMSPPAFSRLPGWEWVEPNLPNKQD